MKRRTGSSTNTSWSGERRAFPDATRRLILRRDPRCRCTGWCGLHAGRCTAPSTVADHVTPHAEGGTDDAGNGQGLCADCHDVKTGTEAARGRLRRSHRRAPAPHPGTAGTEHGTT